MTELEYVEWANRETVQLVREVCQMHGGLIGLVMIQCKEGSGWALRLVTGSNEMSKEDIRAMLTGAIVALDEKEVTNVIGG